MINNIDTLYLPLNVDKEITFMLFNYKNINKLIEQRKLELIDNMKVTNDSYLKAIHRSNNTLEDIIIKFDTDYNINRLNKWRRLINSFINTLDNENDLISYYLIYYKYFNTENEENIKETLNLSSEELKYKDIKLKQKIYKEAIKQKLYKGVEE